ncbi:hypothetical protein B484DRAFT_446503 [Ochromonadaceae sp. CCMP2298]|nr:hypothetical protein B484DRAFT_446503 [Ochromonadaceae sp. CCMP2298]
MLLERPSSKKNILETGHWPLQWRKRRWLHICTKGGLHEQGRARAHQLFSYIHAVASSSLSSSRRLLAIFSCSFSCTACTSAWSVSALQRFIHFAISASASSAAALGRPSFPAPPSDLPSMDTGEKAGESIVLYCSWGVARTAGLVSNSVALETDGACSPTARTARYGSPQYNKTAARSKTGADTSMLMWLPPTSP